MSAIYSLAIVGLALGGLIVALYIRRTKLRGEKLLCPLNANCDAVVHSRYSTLFGIPVEIYGLGYYAALIIFYGLGLLMPPLSMIRLINIVVSLASLGGALFSLYLLYVQLQKLKEWCTWCLLSSLFSVLIFLATLGLWLG